MTTTATPESPSTVEGLLPGMESTGGGAPRANTAAADAAASLARDAAAVGGGEPGPKVGRASPRAKAGFNSKKSKEELIRLGRELAEKHAALEERVAAAQGDTPAAATEDAPPPIDPATLIPGLTKLTELAEQFLIAWRGDHWDFGENKAGQRGTEEIATAAAPVVAKKAPALGEHLDTFMLVMTIAGIALPRLKQDRLHREARERGDGGTAIQRSDAA